MTTKSTLKNWQIALLLGLLAIGSVAAVIWNQNPYFN